MRITIIASIAIETDRLTSSIPRATVLLFLRPAVSLRPEARPSGDSSGEQSVLIICANCLPELCSLPFNLNLEAETENVK